MTKFHVDPQLASSRRRRRWKCLIDLMSRSQDDPMISVDDLHRSSTISHARHVHQYVQAPPATS